MAEPAAVMSVVRRRGVTGIIDARRPMIITNPINQTPKISPPTPTQKSIVVSAVTRLQASSVLRSKF